jgi:hypothetical protein
MLASAKRNLESIAFFGLQEDMRRSQYVFERTFGLSFVRTMENWNASKSDDTVLSEAQLRRVRALNVIDVDFYAFARRLFYERFEQLKAADPLFALNFAS